MTRGPVVFMALVLLACAAVFVFSEQASAPTINIRENPQDDFYTEEVYKNRTMDIETFISVHIGELSPVQEVLGGKFYVTEVTADNGEGVVRYEDGHMQYVADFRYALDPNEGYTITRFRVRR